MVPIATALVFCAVLVSTADAQTPGVTKSKAPPPTQTSKPVRENWITGEVKASRLSDKEAAYIGDGDDLYANDPGSGLGAIVRPMHNGKESGEYFGGEIHSTSTAIVGVDRLAGLRHVAYPCSNCTLLVVYLRIQECLRGDLYTFNPLQVELAEKAGPLVAAGSEGSYVFAKNAASWENSESSLRSIQGGKFPSGETWEFGYVFAVSKETSVWKLVYHGIQIAEVKPEKK